MNKDFLFNQNNELGVLVCGHGSRNRAAVDEFAQLVKSIEQRLPGIPIEYGYLEFARPILNEALDRLKARSVKRVLAIPAMLFAAGHTKNDIPSLLNKYSLKNKLQIDFGKELGIDRLMINAAGARILETIRNASYVPLSQTMLAVVGRGSSDPDANSNVAKITRMLVEAFGFGWGETLYSGVTFPLVEPGLRHIANLGFKRIIVLPYFLFSGVLVSRIYQHTNLVAKDKLDIEFLQSKYLGNHPLVVDTFIERIKETYTGDTAMNCSLCKYRDQVLGFEKDVGLPQASHHHHVEGIEAGCELCEYECTGACQEQVDASIDLPEGHSHKHDHAHYPHSDHPLGPLSLISLAEDKHKKN